jgi:hypothetical protein
MSSLDSQISVLGGRLPGGPHGHIKITCGVDLINVI